MYFLIGVVLLIAFFIILYFIIRFRIRRFLDQFGFAGMNIKDIVEEARLEDEEIPKSLASMESVYLKQIHKDFPELSVEELKKKAEILLMDCYHAIVDKNTGSLKGKSKAFAEAKIQEYKDSSISLRNFKIHNTVLSKYRKDSGIVVLTFSTAFEYYLEENGKEKKIQDRVKIDFLSVWDFTKCSVAHSISIHCPNCGSPISSLQDNHCEYCGGAVLKDFGKVFVCNDIVQY